MQKTIVLQLDSLDKLNFRTDSSLYLANYFFSIGYQIFIYEPYNLKLSDKPAAAGFYLDFSNDLLFSPYLLENVNFSLSEAEMILIRNDPPVNMQYLTPLYMLDSISHIVINRPKAIISNVEKLIPFSFPKFQAPTLVTSDLQAAFSFLDQHKDIVVKPLYGHGGRGVVRINNPASLAALDFTVEPLVFQPFLPNISKGDKRIFIVNGEVVAAFTKLAAPGNFVTNTAAGGTIEKCVLTQSDMNIVDTLNPWLKEQGIFMAGLDVLDGVLFEVNITSPTGLKAASMLYEKDFAKPAAELLLKATGY